MWLIRLIVKMVLMMLVLPALGLIAFHGGLWTGFIAALLIGVVGVFTTIVMLPALFTVGLFAEIGATLAAGAIGFRLMAFVIETVLFAITLALVAAMLSGVALVGFWPTIGAAAILAVASNVLSSHK